MPNKRSRQSKIRQLINSERIETQEALLDALRRVGIEITQATLSRDLREMGVSKMPEGLGRFVYRIAPTEPSPTRRDLAGKFKNFVREIRSTGNLIIVKTAPGEAPGVARVIDLAALQGILGTVAGDDTILIVAQDAGAGRPLVQSFRKMMT